MEIEVGEYIRTKNGKIDKVINNNCYMPQYIECEKSLLYKEDIVNHSKNIIDLIQVGDIIEINKGKYEVIYDKSLEQLGVLIPNRNHLAIRHSTLEHIFREYKDIRILTKERYQANCYTVERKEEC